MNKIIINKCKKHLIYLKRNDKAFTLVELMISIIVLGIVVTIAIIAVSSIVNTTKVDIYVKNEKSLVKIAESYLAAEIMNYPANIGDSIEIKLSDLKSTGYIGSIKNPDNRSVECDGYVIVTKIEAEEYSYTPHIDCINGRGSSSEDGLVAHYTFDDFQEPTVNLLTNPLNFTWYYWANTSIGWNMSTQTMNSDYDFDGQMRKFTITPGTAVGSSNAQVYSSNNSIISGKTYGVSFYVKALVGRKMNVSMIKSTTPYTNFVTSPKDFNITNSWQRFEATFTANATATDARIQINLGYDLQADEIYIYKPQFEERAPSPFVNGTRNAKINDYSINNNSITMALNSSPKWVSDSVIGSGAYEFDGINNYLNLGSINESILRQGRESNDFTLSAWIKTTSNQDASGRIILARPGWHDGLSMTSDNRVTFGLYDENSNHRGITSPVLDFNTKHQVIGIYNNKVMYLYVDGVLAGTNNFFSANPTIRFKDITSPFATGAAIGGTVHQFRGIIDDLRIYNRALNADEILLNYNIDLYKNNNK